MGTKPWPPSPGHYDHKAVETFHLFAKSLNRYLFAHENIAVNLIDSASWFGTRVVEIDKRINKISPGTGKCYERRD